MTSPTCSNQNTQDISLLDQKSGMTNVFLECPVTPVPDQPVLIAIAETPIPQELVSTEPSHQVSSWHQWYDALRKVWSIYLATHIAFILLTYLAILFRVQNFSYNQMPLSALLNAWNRWDTSQFTAIAANGYESVWRTAFFPLYPMLEKGLSLLTHDPYIAGLLLSNLATLALFTVFYRLIAEDFEPSLAYRAVLYLGLFPTAFFLASAYNEALFLCLTLLSFYYMRRGQWWWAGVYGLLASLTRSAGLLLLLPFAYEYLCQHEFSYRKLGFDALSSILIIAGTGLFALYCALRFHDPLAFAHAQAYWGRQITLPGIGFARTLWVIRHNGPLSFSAIHGAIDLSAGLLMLLLTVLCFVGPWKFRTHQLAYGLYAVAVYLFLVLFPGKDVPLQSLSRLVLEIFPAFIILAMLGRKASFHLYYLMLSGSLLSFMLLQFLTGYWIV